MTNEEFVEEVKAAAPNLQWRFFSQTSNQDLVSDCYPFAIQYHYGSWSAYYDGDPQHIVQVSKKGTAVEALSSLSIELNSMFKRAEFKLNRLKSDMDKIVLTDDNSKE